MASNKSKAQRQAFKGNYRSHVYTPEQIAWLAAQNGTNRTTTDICAEFNQVFQAALNVMQIRRKLKAMGVSYQSQALSHKAGFMSAHYTETGAPHPREKPLGTIRKGRDGLEIKVANAPKAGRKNWLPLAKHVYQTAHNIVVQRDEMILHIDGNSENNDLDNLILVKRRDIGAINMALSLPENQNATPEIRLSLILMTRITQTRQAKTGETTASMRHHHKKRQQEKQSCSH